MGETVDNQARPGRRRLWLRALTAAVVYFGTAVIWFATFERLSEKVAVTPEEAARYKGLTGLFFVVGSAVGVSWIVWRELRKQQRIQDELRASQAQLAKLIESAMDAIISVDSNGKIVVFNPAAQRLFGCSAAEAYCRDVKLFIPEFTETGHRSGAAGPNGANSRLWALRARRLDASEFCAEASVSDREAGTGLAYTLVVRDVTERLKLEEQLRHTNTTLEQRVAERTADLQVANRELESFCYSVAHDLRAPVRSIRGFNHLLNEEAHDALKESAQGYLTRIDASAKRMEELIDAWLELSRTARGEIRCEMVDLSALAAAVVSELRQIHSERQVEFECPPEVPVRGDPSLLRILLQNLLGNAWKFTANARPARIEFGVRRRDEGTPIFFVRDNGAGFEMKHAANLFQPFQRLHQCNEYEGTGIGLATCQKIVLRHGGCIWAEAQVNQGAILYFSLPERSVPAEPSPASFMNDPLRSMTSINHPHPAVFGRS